MENYQGRLLLETECTAITDFNNLTKLSAMTEVSRSKIICNRCGSSHSKADVLLLIGAYYCPSCIQLGRIRSDQFLYHFPQGQFEKKSCLLWAGKLSPQQDELASQLLQAIALKQELLIHAITGAGKTEMIYQAIDQALQNGQAVAIASPRVDVCIELHARLSRDFSCRIPLLHADGDPYFRSALTILTTHQLMRFKEAFDLLIIDEVDAFPFVNNAMLHHAVAQAKTKTACSIYLTATSTAELEKEVQKGRMKKLELARRFHQNPLVVPQFFWQTQFIKQLKQQRKSGFPLLIFVPEIKEGQGLTDQLKIQFPKEKIGFVASTTENRHQLVSDFRQNKLSILVSSSILERGVTFPKVDVFIVQAHHAHFSSSALIQMAGRVGRSTSRPTGLVFLFHEGKTRAMLKARKEIKKMNQKGGF
ncbi:MULTISPECIES: DEAD/DEAH box helicase [unclassified Lactococcus]|uniref:DEAD/DEAH box helicase n=1 Tax=unclassified Lactococcus TaxID=2643510 RepID=UPI0011CB915B|nr:MULTISPECIES: DEAD/DEAH box helicase [unclassified Lactococcus]MQW23121.1 DNA/RNA helicase [Lactococcus sp. dk101]TXK44175.1 DEAD/DEAH box helicase [Lactococcus sp. dk310]TXK49906.1 DEAD/DEAH box helicase [Lactococcus sp. dk322]